MKRDPLDIYDKRPEEMINYLSHYGWHFNKKMAEFAINHMQKDGTKLKSITAEKLNEMLNLYGIHIDNDILYDKLYVANMLKADFLGQGIPDDKSLTKAVKAYLDDEDGYDGIAFSRFYTDTIKKGIPIDWEGLL